jgi:hypothetical protein
MTYGCHNRRPYKQFFQPKPMEKRISVHIEFKMAMDFQYTKTELGRKDQGCIGCKWRMPDALQN